MYSGMNVPPLARVTSGLATDFSDMAIGSQLQNATYWSRQDHIGTTDNVISADSTSISGQVVTMSVTGTAGDTIAFTKMPSASSLTTVDVLVLWKVSLTPDSVGGCGPTVRLGNSGQNGYNAVPLVSSGNKMENAEFLNQNRTGNVGGQLAVAWDTSHWWWTRLHASGTTISSATWQYGTDESAATVLLGTDTSYSSGYVGLMSRPNVALKFAWFSVATSGKAPFPNG